MVDSILQSSPVGKSRITLSVFVVGLVLSVVINAVIAGAGQCSCTANKDTSMKGDVDFVEDSFGFLKNNETGKSELVRRFTMTNKNGMSVQIITYGGIITSLKVPDKNGRIDDVVLGFDDMAGYVQVDNPYFGAVIGRVANRIKGGKFSIGDQNYQVSLNKGTFQLHGGFKGFDKAIWESHVEDTKLTLSYSSSDGEEGYPGQILAQATYQLTADNQLILEMTATSTKPTPVNLCNHSYFNLAGHTCGATGVYEHMVSINADHYTVTDDTIIPTGELKSVGGTILDLRIPRLLGEVLPQVPGGGYDHNLCVNRGIQRGMNFVARAVHPGSGRVLEIHSDQPGVQFYTSNFLPDVLNGAKPLVGKNNTSYAKHGAFCFETQNYPDAVNHANFPDSVLRPGSTYSHTVTYRFGLL